jgi:hypothetical protein
VLRSDHRIRRKRLDVRDLASSAARSFQSLASVLNL